MAPRPWGLPCCSRMYSSAHSSFGDPPLRFSDEGSQFGETGFDGGSECGLVAGLAVGSQVVDGLVAALAENEAAGEGHVFVAAAPDVQDGRLLGLPTHAVVQGKDRGGATAVGPDVLIEREQLTTARERRTKVQQEVGALRNAIIAAMEDNNGRPVLKEQIKQQLGKWSGAKLN